MLRNGKPVCHTGNVVGNNPSPVRFTESGRTVRKLVGHFRRVRHIALKQHLNHFPCFPGHAEHLLMLVQGLVQKTFQFQMLGINVVGKRNERPGRGADIGN